MTATDHRALAVALFNATWKLLEQPSRTPADDDRLVHTAHASRHHWGEVGVAENLVRGEWLCSRVYAVLGRSEPAAHHANRALAIATEAGLEDWDLAFCYEAVGRAAAVAGDQAGATAAIEKARAVPIAEAEDQELLASDLDSIASVSVRTI